MKQYEQSPLRGDDTLEALTPARKARQFRLLLPLILQKIAQGVEHAEILKALEKRGLYLTRGTYFSYLNRYRSHAASRTNKNTAEAEGPRTLGSASSPATSAIEADAGGRPPSFDYDPRGIHPDLLK